MTMTAPDPITHLSDGRPRGRGLGLPFSAVCGPNNAITDVSGVTVGYCTLIAGQAIRTGVTAVFPRGRDDPFSPVWSGFYALNGNGEITGVQWIEEAGWFIGPICLTNTHSVGMVHHASTRWLINHSHYQNTLYPWLLPVISETCDAHLNDINGLHITPEHVEAAFADAHAGPVQEGNVGGGTGMICYEFKGGTGTASRRVAIGAEQYTVGALVQASFGRQPQLTICGVPVGRYLPDPSLWPSEQGSIVVLLATDAPLLPIQLKRMARRAALGVGRTGTPSGNGSGDFMLAFSTAQAAAQTEQAWPALSFVPHELLDPLFLAVVESVEESIINALIAAETMTGKNGNTVHALDHRQLLDVMGKHQALVTRGVI